MTDSVLISSRPYIVRAVYQWINDNALTPFVLANAELEGVEVPQEFIKQGKIVLNISPDAVAELALENDFVSFNGRFSGVDLGVYLPIQAILAIYAQENTMGVFFEKTGDIQPPPKTPKIREAKRKPQQAEKPKPSFLKVVK